MNLSLDRIDDGGLSKLTERNLQRLREPENVAATITRLRQNAHRSHHRFDVNNHCNDCLVNSNRRMPYEREIAITR